MVKRRENEFLNNAEIEAIKGACENIDDQVLVWGLLYTAMRVGELVHMQKSWIDFERKTIRIPEYTDDGWHPKISGSKVSEITGIKSEGHCSNGTIVILNDELITILKHPKAIPFGMNEHQSWRRIRYLAKKGGLDQPNISPHVLRHTALTLMCLKGYTAPALASQARHADSSTAQKCYIEKNAIDLKDELKRHGGI